MAEKQNIRQVQPPSGGCVLKPVFMRLAPFLRAQPPSGGCVLKPLSAVVLGTLAGPAAFGRLCVETPDRLG